MLQTFTLFFSTQVLKNNAELGPQSTLKAAAVAAVY